MTIEENIAETKRLLDIASYHNTLCREYQDKAKLNNEKMDSFTAENDRGIARIETEMREAEKELKNEAV